MSGKRYLLELGTEAIPAGYLADALTAIEVGMKKGLESLRLPVESVTTRGTAQRLVLEIAGLADRQADVTLEVTGPRVDIAFKDGAPTKAAEGFARKNGVAVEALEQVTTDKGTFVAARVHETGREVEVVLPELLTRVLGSLAWPKTMRWNASGFRFPRPLRWVVSLLDDAVLPFTLGGIEAGRRTRGHRLHGAGWHEVPDAGALERVLESAGVILDPQARGRLILAGLNEAAEQLGGRCVMDEDLLEEVVFLAQHPRVYSGSFDEEFLELPREVTVTAMKAHQRYFAVEGKDGALRANFLVVTDGEWDDPALVLAGNERVLRARLADARFYWDVDRKTGLDAMAQALDKVVWLESVGTLAEKAERVHWLVERLGRFWYADDWAAMGEGALRAARLAKADLASEMIKDGKEFTGLQGIIGARYAASANEAAGVVKGLEEQYRPQGAGDRLPESREGLLLSVADKFDTIAGCWAAGFVPSGSQDPYALRRAANGIVRILLDKSLQLPLTEIVSMAVRQLPEAVRRDGLEQEILDFFRDRVAFALRDRGIAYDVVEAVLAAELDDPWLVHLRATALETIRGEEDLARLVIGFKRVANIVKSADVSGLPKADTVDWSATDASEQGLFAAAERVGRELDEARALQDFPRAVQLYLSLRDPIDRFFDGVMVMSEDPAERARRLALLDYVAALFRPVFDPSRIVLEGESVA